MSAVVATSDVNVVTPVFDTLTCAVGVLSLTLNNAAVCDATPFTASVTSPVVSPVIATPAFTTTPSFTVKSVNVPAAGVVAPIVASTVPLLMSTFVIACVLKSIAPTAWNAPSFVTVNVSVLNVRSLSPLSKPSVP